MIEVRCKNINITRSFAEGTTLLDVFKGFPELDFPYPPMSARVNNSSQGLKFRVYQSRDVEFLDIRTWGGMRAYVRSL